MRVSATANRKEIGSVLPDGTRTVCIRIAEAAGRAGASLKKEEDAVAKAQEFLRDRQAY